MSPHLSIVLIKYFLYEYKTPSSLGSSFHTLHEIELYLKFSQRFPYILYYFNALKETTKPQGMIVFYMFFNITCNPRFFIRVGMSKYAQDFYMLSNINAKWRIWGQTESLFYPNANKLLWANLTSKLSFSSYRTSFHVLWWYEWIW